MPLKDVVVINIRLTQDFNGVGAGRFDIPLGLLDVGDFFFRLGAAATVEELAVWCDLQPAFAQRVGVDDGHSRWHDYGSSVCSETIEQVRDRGRVPLRAA